MLLVGATGKIIENSVLDIALCTGDWIAQYLLLCPAWITPYYPYDLCMWYLPNPSAQAGCETVFFVGFFRF